MEHHFNVQLACHFGVNAAVIARNFQYWCAKVEANESAEHFHDGRYWVYNSRRALAKLFPYLSEKQIRTALEALVLDGVLLKGHFSKGSLNRTSWYSYNGAEWAMTQLSDEERNDLGL